MQCIVLCRCNATQSDIQGGSNMTATNCDLFTHKSSRSYLNHLVYSFTYVSKKRDESKFSKCMSYTKISVCTYQVPYAYWMPNSSHSHPPSNASLNNVMSNAQFRNFLQLFPYFLFYVSFPSTLNLLFNRNGKICPISKHQSIETFRNNNHAMYLN